MFFVIQGLVIFVGNQYWCEESCIHQVNGTDQKVLQH